MFFKEIEIQNFRGIESLTISNIGQVNLIGGRNNCGKTSILEAVFLLVGISNPQLIINIHAFRDLLLTDDEDFSYLFKNFDFSKKLQITGKFNLQTRALKIEPIYSTQQDDLLKIIPSEKFISNSSNTYRNEIDGLRLKFNIDNKEFNNEIKIKQGAFESKISTGYKEKIISSFINAKNITDTIRSLDAILVKKNLEIVINALQEIEPNLSDIRIGDRGMIYVDIGMDNLIPINIIGDGIRRIISILSAIAEKRDAIILIDEIENGLHYSALSTLWKAVFKIALANNVQLFITTHSYECIQAFASVRKQYDIDISYFRIDKNNGHKALQYNSDTLDAGIEREFEVR